MPSDYKQIERDNKKKYGEGENHIEILSGMLYAERAHFIFELLQNAEDAGASKVLFELRDNVLEVKHDGRPFNESDVRGVCGICEGTKSGDDMTQIGEFGIGFKSVYAYTKTPEIHSGDEHFCICKYVRPDSVSPKKIEDSLTTYFLFPFNKDGQDPKEACREIGERLRNLSVRTVLFLKKIKEVEYRLPDKASGLYLRGERES